MLQKFRLTLFYTLAAIILVCAFTLVNAYECTDKPILEMSGEYHLYQNTNFIYQIPISNNENQSIIFSTAVINSTLGHFNLYSTGLINFTPTEADLGTHRVMIIVTNQEFCFDTKLVEFIVHGKPIITNYTPFVSNLMFNETFEQSFEVNATSLGSYEHPENLEYEWYVDGAFLSYNKDFSYKPGYDDAGRHNITVLVKNELGLNSSHKWSVTVNNLNRAPLLLNALPNLVIYPKESIALYNLNDYFKDPDKDQMAFKYYFTEKGDISVKANTSKYFDIDINENGEVTFTSKMNVYNTEYVRFIAVDVEGATAPSNVFSLRVVTPEDKVEFFWSEDEKCIVNIVCGLWSECLPTSLKYRECYDSNNCNKENKTYLESERCYFNASCSDGLQNQNESGVDCGGPCELCPSCDDGILNQGEIEIDCGGPCSTCPTCNDSIKNQDESDIDCGGKTCATCVPLKSCKLHSDCTSFNCVNNTCMNPTCNDYRKNQDEEGIDCGGLCDPCPSCIDKIINQGETGIDCGGPCKPCASCSDRIKNQGEIFTDCGGPCGNCLLLFIKENLIKGLIGIAIILLVLGFMFLLRRARFNDKYDLLIRLNRHLPLYKKDDDTKVAIVNTLINNLRDLQNKLSLDIPDEELSQQYFSIVKGFIKEVFNLDDTFTVGILKHQLVKIIRNPFSRSLIYNTYKDFCQEASSPISRLELTQRIEQVIYVLDEIKIYL